MYIDDMVIDYNKLVEINTRRINEKKSPINVRIMDIQEGMISFKVDSSGNGMDTIETFLMWYMCEEVIIENTEVLRDTLDSH